MQDKDYELIKQVCVQLFSYEEWTFYKLFQMPKALSPEMLKRK